MPWEHCGETEIPDDVSCPSCGENKANWTMQFGQIRTFTLRRRPALRLELVDARGDPCAGEPFRVELPDGGAEEGELDEQGRARRLDGGSGRVTVVFPRRLPAAVRRTSDPPEGVTDGAEGDEARFECEVGRPANFALAGLRLILRKPDGTPLGGVRYQLVVGDETLEGTTPAEGDDAGLVDQVFPEGAETADLIVFVRDGGPGHKLRLKLRALAPTDDPKGVQARLNALGYAAGAVDGDPGEATRAALKRFQAAHGLGDSGEIDDATRAKLAELYGS